MVQTRGGEKLIKRSWIFLVDHFKFIQTNQTEYDHSKAKHNHTVYVLWDIYCVHIWELSDRLCI